MAHAVNPGAGRTQLLFRIRYRDRYRWQFRRYLLEFLYLYSGHTASSRAIVALNYCTMPGPSMSYFPEERAAPM
jgi:hypothetical protein